MDTKLVKQQYKLNQWTKIIRECRSSGKVIKVWCEEHDISLASYYYWLKKIRQAACNSLPQVNEDDNNIVAVPTFTESAHATPNQDANSYALRLNIGEISLELTNNASTELIVNTLKVLGYAR